MSQSIKYVKVNFGEMCTRHEEFSARQPLSHKEIWQMVVFTELIIPFGCTHCGKDLKLKDKINVLEQCRVSTRTIN